MTKLKVLAVSLVFFAILPGQARAQQTTAPAPLPSLPTSVVSSDDYSNPHFLHDKVVFQQNDVALVRQSIQPKIDALLKAKDFTALDNWAAELRKSKKQTANGDWHLSIFYSLMCELADDAPDQIWLDRLNFFGVWAQDKPNSITARVALGTTMKNYAWKARTSDWASKVTEEGWKLFAERLALARKYLMAARSLKEKCPMWWDTMLFVALGEQWDDVDYDKLFNEAVAYEPNYVWFYNDKVVHLMPRWSGTEGDWQKFAAQSADKLGGDVGNVLYARLGWRVHERRFYDGFIHDGGYNWGRLKEGLTIIMKQYPESQTVVNELAYLSSQAGDPVGVKPLFVKIKAAPDANIWNSDESRFFRARYWALSQPDSVLNNEPAHTHAEVVPAAVPVPTTAMTASTSRPSAELHEGDLILKGISGTKDRRLALINNQTFMAGETANVKIRDNRVEVTCKEIREDSALILVSGKTQELKITQR